MTTTQIVAVCPSCGTEVTLRLSRVEVEVEDTIRVSHTDEEMTLGLKVFATGSARHHCAGPPESPLRS